jgi:hypothetical protein
MPLGNESCEFSIFFLNFIHRRRFSRSENSWKCCCRKYAAFFHGPYNHTKYVSFRAWTFFLFCSFEIFITSPTWQYFIEHFPEIYSPSRPYHLEFKRANMDSGLFVISSWNNWNLFWFCKYNIEMGARLSVGAHDPLGLWYRGKLLCRM